MATTGRSSRTPYKHWILDSLLGKVVGITSIGSFRHKNRGWYKTPLKIIDLCVVGSQTSTVQPDGHVPEFAPEFDWIVDVVNQCRKAKVPYYLKANLGLDRPGMNLPKMNPRDK